MESDLSTIAVDLGEVALDSVLDEGLLRDIPVLGTIVNLAKAVSSIRDRVFLVKIRAFFEPCASLTDGERASFHDRMQKDPAFKAKVEEVLVLYLDKCDALKKAQIFGAVFIGLVRNAIDIETFHRVIYCVDQSFVMDIAALDRYPKVGEVGFKNFRMEPIALSGLMRQTNMIECHITPEGQKLLQLMHDAGLS
jgi:hypothetical protein